MLNIVQCIIWMWLTLFLLFSTCACNIFFLWNWDQIAGIMLRIVYVNAFFYLSVNIGKIYLLFSREKNFKECRIWIAFMIYLFLWNSIQTIPETGMPYSHLLTEIQKKTLIIVSVSVVDCSLSFQLYSFDKR